MALINVITQVVDHGLCSGCGVCVGVCPSSALDMCTLANGDLAACRVGKCSEHCDLCLQVCPFANGLYDPRQDNVNLYGPKAQSAATFQEHIGWYRSCFAGFSQVDNHRSQGASGGLVTWCLEALLTNGLVDKVTVVRLTPQSSGPLFEFKAAQSVEEIRGAAGSVYHPVAISDLLKEMVAEPDTRWAVVCIPCLCAAVRRAAARFPHLQQSVRYVLGLACGMLQNTMYTEMLLAKSGIGLTEMTQILYRHKLAAGPANDYGFIATNHEGKETAPIRYMTLPYFLGRNAYFRYNACNYCKDVFAEVADACFMDAWLPEYATDPQGTSLVVVRSEALEELLLAGAAADDLQLDRIAPERVVLSQQSQVRRKQELLRARLPREDEAGPEVVSISWQERFDWWLQRATQYRSKRAWDRYGRRYGRFVFWVAMGDLATLQVIFTKVMPWLMSLPKRVMRKMANIFGHIRNRL